MVEERPKRRRKKGKARAKKAQPKKKPVLEDSQLPGLLEGDIPRGVPVTEEEVVGEEQPRVVAEGEAVEEEQPPVVAEEEAVEEARPPVVAEEETVEEAQPPVVAEEEAVEEAIEAADPARKPEPSKGPVTRPFLTEKLMSVPEFRQRVVKLVVQKLI